MSYTGPHRQSGPPLFLPDQQQNGVGLVLSGGSSGRRKRAAPARSGDGVSPRWSELVHRVRKAKTYRAVRNVVAEANQYRDEIPEHIQVQLDNLVDARLTEITAGQVFSGKAIRYRPTVNSYGIRIAPIPPVVEDFGEVTNGARIVELIEGETGPWPYTRVYAVTFPRGTVEEWAVAEA